MGSRFPQRDLTGPRGFPSTRLKSFDELTWKRTSRSNLPKPRFACPPTRFEFAVKRRTCSYPTLRSESPRVVGQDALDKVAAED